MLSPFIFVGTISWALYFFYQSQDWKFFKFILLCTAILLFFTVLITKLKKKGHKSAGELMARTLTFWWILSLIAVALTTHPIFMFLLILFFSIAALWEYYAMMIGVVDFRPLLKEGLLLCSSVGVLASHLFLYYQHETSFWMFGFLMMGVFLPSIILWSRNHRKVNDLSMGFCFFGLLLPLSWSLYSLNLSAFLLTFFLTEIRDLVSYWLGKGLAKVNPASPTMRKILYAKVAEHISPNKTWAVGILSTLVLLLIGLLLNNSIFPMEGLSQTELNIYLLNIGIWGLFGDLVFSLVKRNFNVKDSGTWFPGGSGIIDRIDALVLTIPTSYFFLRMFY
jgi:phosphatidate cytidylyltransferase